MKVRLTLLDDAAVHTLAARRHADTLLVAPEDLAAATGWTLKPEGLCRGSVCVPARGGVALVVDGAIDLRVFAALLGRPLALDVEQAVAVLGVPAPDRHALLASLRAPDFTLPDVDGRPFTLSSLGRRKKLLVAWASW